MKIILCLLAIIAHSHTALGSTIKVGSSPVISSAGIYLAEKRGYFKEQGLDVNITDFNNSGAPMTVLLSKGELDVGAGNLSSGLFNAFLKGQKFKIVADKGHLEKNKDYISLLVRADHIQSGRYKSLKDLKGFKMGLTALDGVSQQILAERFLSKAGLKSTDVEFLKLSYPEMNLALKAKNIDATIQLEPYLTKAAIDDIAKIVASGTEVYPNQQSAAIFFSPQFAENRKDDAVKFLKAYLKGVRDYNKALYDASEKSKMISDLKTVIKLDNEKIWEQMIPVGLRENGTIDQAALADDLKWYVEKKYIPSMPDVHELIDNSFVKKAYEELSSFTKK